MVTPVTAEGKLDEPALDRLVDSLLAGGVDGIFVMGTTGEGCIRPARLSVAAGEANRRPRERQDAASSPASVTRIPRRSWRATIISGPVLMRVVSRPPMAIRAGPNAAVVSGTFGRT